MSGAISLISPGGSGSGKCVVSKIVATEAIPSFSVATSDGKQANSANIAHVDKVVGIAKVAISSGFSGSIVGEGEIKNDSWSWSIGDVLFLNGVAVSTVAPSTGFRVILGQAIASDTIYVKISESIIF